MGKSHLSEADEMQTSPLNRTLASLRKNMAAYLGSAPSASCLQHAGAVGTKQAGTPVPAGENAADRNSLTQELFPASDARFPEERRKKLDNWLASRESTQHANVDAMMRWMKINRDEAEDLRALAAELIRAARMLEESGEYVSGHCADWLHRHGLTYLAGTEGTLRLRHSAALQVDDEAIIPAEWWVEKVSRSLSKSGILAALKRGIAVPGCSLVDRRTMNVK